MTIITLMDNQNFTLKLFIMMLYIIVTSFKDECELVSSEELISTSLKAIKSV